MSALNVEGKGVFSWLLEPWEPSDQKVGFAGMSTKKGRGASLNPCVRTSPPNRTARETTNTPPHISLKGTMPLIVLNNLGQEFT